MQGAINFDFSKNDTGTGICSSGYYCKSGKYSFLTKLELCISLTAYDA